MKKLMTVILVALLGAGGMTSCKKESTDPPAPTPPTTYLRATVNGSAWSANGAAALDVGSTMQISGATLTGSSIMLILEKPLQVGTYIANANTVNTFMYTKGFASSPFTTQEGAGQGTLNITAVSATMVEGTFQFTGVNFNGDSKQITAGSFKTSIQ